MSTVLISTEWWRAERAKKSWKICVQITKKLDIFCLKFLHVLGFRGRFCPQNLPHRYAPGTIKHWGQYKCTHCECRFKRFSDNRRSQCTHLNWCSECFSDNRRPKCTHFDCCSECFKCNRCNECSDFDRPSTSATNVQANDSDDEENWD